MIKAEPVRVAHIIGKWVGGGVEAVVMNYYRNIDRNKVQFDFICDSDSTNIPYEEINSLGGRVIIVPPYQKIFKYMKELKKVLKDNNYEIVHSHINTLSVFPLRCAKKARVPVRIAHSHSTTNKVEWKKNILKQVLKSVAKVFATDYMACTEHAGNWMFGNDSNVYILNNAIDLDKFKYEEDIRISKRKELGIADDIIVIGHIGRFVRQKNHKFIIDVFNEIHKENSKTVLMLVGQGPLVDEIKELIKALNLSDSVYFLGQREDVHELYQAFDAFLFPSLYEGLGMVAIEAQTSGLYCLCSTEVPMVAKVTDNIDFLDLEVSADKWAKVLLASLENINRKDYSKEVSENGYDIKLEVKKLEKKYLDYRK